MRSRAAVSSRTLGTVWRTVSSTLFAILCLRFQIAELHGAAADPFSVLLTIVGGFALGAWNRRSAMFAFTCAVPILTGLWQASFLNVNMPQELMFSAIWIGITVGRLWNKNRLAKLEGKAISSIPNAQNPTREGPNAFGSSSLAAAGEPYRIHPFVDILIYSVFLSLGLQLWRHRSSIDFPSVLFSRATFAYSDPLYFVTSAFLWLQGLFYFQQLLGDENDFNLEKNSPRFSCLGSISSIRTIFVVYGVTMATFQLIQFFFNIPEGWVGLAGSTSFHPGIVFQAPYEDISSFGSVAVSVLVYFMATTPRLAASKLALRHLGCLGLFVMVIVSWSRAAWLTLAVFILVISAIRLSRLWTAAVILVLAISIAAVNSNANRPSWVSEPYLIRLVSLVRFENPRNKDAGRLNIYKRAEGMISSHPILGNGIGSFYITSVKYSAPNDPSASTPNFAHNAILQIAAEEGVPIALLFASLALLPVVCGYREWHRPPATIGQPSARILLILGLTLSLAAYLQTQMTANSLNVYASNQFFFWLLMGALIIANADQGIVSQNVSDAA